VESFLGIKPGLRWLDWAKGVGLAAIGALGLKWLLCKENLLNNNPNSCNSMADLSTLLGLFTSAFALAELETIVKGVQAIEVDAVKAMTEIVHVESDLFG